MVKSVYAINDFLQNSWDGSANEIELVTNTVQPRGSKEELSKIKDNLRGFLQISAARQQGVQPM